MNLSNWLNQSNEKTIAYGNEHLVSNNANDMASVEPSNEENIPCKTYYASFVNRPNIFHYYRIIYSSN